MPKNEVSDLITEKEIAFARLVLSGTMTDRDAAQAVGLNPDTAAYIKTKPHVRAWMAEHRAAQQQQWVEQEAEERRLRNISREQVLTRLWEIANMGPEMTRGSMTSQVKSLSIIVAMESMIPDRRAGSPAHSSAKHAATPPSFYRAEWHAEQQRKAAALQADPAFAQEEDEPHLAEPEPTPAPPDTADEPSESTFPNRFSDPDSTDRDVNPSATTPPAPHVLVFDDSPDTREPFSIKTGPFARRRWTPEEETETSHHCQ